LVTDTELSGFTALTERLSARGAAGVEQLTLCVNSYFAAVLEVIFEHGGDALRFVGDAMIVAFLANEELGEADALCGVTLCAARCACKLAASLGHVQMQADGSVVPCGAATQAAAAGGTILSLKLSLGAGQLRLLTLGGGGAAGEQRWEFLASDPILPDAQSMPPVFTAQIACADADGLKGVAVASPQVIELLASVAHCDALALPSGAFMLKSVTALSDAAPALPPLPAALALGLELPPCMASLPQSGPAMRAAVDLLQAFLLNSIRSSVQAGLFEFLDEVRDCTIVFCGIPSLTARRAAGAPPVDECALAQSVVLAVQRAVGDADGAFLQARCDEKGFVIVSAFGLPGYAHEDGPARGIRAALATAQALAEISLNARLGVTTGRLLCACVGSPGRVEFSAFGNAINLAARLMCAASDKHALLVDVATHDKARSAAVFTELPPLRVKGREAAVKAFAVAPLGESGRQLKSSPVAGPRATPTSGPSVLVGRSAALNAVVDALDATLSGTRGLAAGGVVVIEGDAGMGKSALLRAALEHAAPLALARGAVAASRGDASHINSPLWPWRGIVCDLLMHAHAVATPTGDASGWGGLLAEALDFDLEELPELLPELLPDFRSSKMSRLDCVTAAVEALLRATLATRPVVIVLEDLHACDAASVRLAEALAAACPEALMLLATRPLRADPDADAAAAALARLQKAPRTLTLRLAPLRLEETTAMLQAGAGPDAPPLPPRLIAAVHDRTSGHPLYIEQVIKLIRQRLANASGGELSATDLDSFLRSSASIHAVVTQRIDALRPAAALTLKVAAVTGRTAAKLSLLTAIHPRHPSPRELALDLQELQRLEFLLGTEANDPDTVMFSNAFVRDTAYELMAPAQRRALHLAAAHALHGPVIGGRDAAAGIVWHLCQAAVGTVLSASERDDLVAAWVAAGEVASLRGSHDEAACCFTSGADLAIGSAVGVELRTRAAEAYASAGRLPQAADAALAVLRSIGVHIAPSFALRKSGRRFGTCLGLLCGGCNAPTTARCGSLHLQPGDTAVALRAASVLAQAAAALPESANARSWAEHAQAARNAAQ